MHFAIPDSVEFHHPASRNSFTGFNVHLNGLFHSCLRYKQFHSLHEQLKHTFPSIQLPSFPSKKLFLLSGRETEERRECLERYIQLIGQDPIFSKSELLRSFLLAAQTESAAVASTEVTFEVQLMNGHCVPLKCLSTDSSNRLLELACAAVALPPEFTYYFALFLVGKDEAGDTVIHRKLMDCEAPFITQKTLGSDYRCVLRKSYWDSALDQDLLCDSVGLNLLYIQAVSDNESGIAAAEDSQTREELTNLLERGNKKEYLDYARNLPNYGTVHFKGATVDYPDLSSNATVTIGNKEIIFHTPPPIQETKFRVTRIRCWKITTIHDNEGKTPALELSFEFLMNKNYLKWVKVRSEKAMMMTVCLQSLVSELLLNQRGDSNFLKAPNVTKPNAKISFLKRDDTNQFRPPAAATANGVPRVAEAGDDEESERRPHSAEMAKQRLKEISTTVVFFKNGQDRVHNEAFEFEATIGDDDL